MNSKTKNESLNIQLLDSMVKALSKAIDERSEYTGDHTRNMAAMAERFLDWLEETGSSWHFGPGKRRAFITSVWLHDIGKLAVPRSLLNKSTRLGPSLDAIKERMRIIGLLDRISCLESRISKEELALRNEDRDCFLAFIMRINDGSPLSDDDSEYLERCSTLEYTDENGMKHPWITPYERSCLIAGSGTLSSDERHIVENHAVVTRRILEQVRFPKAFKDVPCWASSHHEKLNGSGYPDHASAEAIPPEARLITILDIFEALTSKIRPYRRSFEPEKALFLMSDMADKGQIDRNILSMFKSSCAWEGVI